MKTLTAALAAVLTTLLFGAGTALAAPAANTGGASNVTSGGAKLNANVDPNGQPTSFYFEYGTTRRYGSRTADANAGSSANAVKVSTDVGGLQPNTTYHYRVVASNPSGVASGDDRTFKTKPQPLGLQIAANPNPVVFGDPTTITGTLTGTGNAGKQVVLQQRGFPYTSDFTTIGNPIVTDPVGNFAFPVLPPTANTQYRVQTVDKPIVSSGVLSLGVAVRVRTNLTKRYVKRGRTTRFFGTIQPSRPGAQFAIQKQTSKGGWVNVGGSITRGGTSEFSRFSKRVRVKRGGNYRVFVLIVDGNYVSGIGRTIRIYSHR